MGRIKSLLIKRTAKQILALKKELFSNDFNHNKKVLGTIVPSKRMRNNVAGYITHLMRQ